MDECCTIDTEEERKLTEITVELHQGANNLLNKDQQDAVKKYVDALCDLEALFVKKAFMKGRKFTA